MSKNAERQRRRRERLQKAAEKCGYQTIDQLANAINSGEIKMNKIELKMKKNELIPMPDPYHADTCGLTRPVFCIFPESGTYGISQSCDTGGTPIEVYNGIIIEREIPVPEGYESCALDPSVETYLQKEGADLVRQVIAGYSTEWDGNNIVGILDDNAEFALEKLVNDLSVIDEGTVVWFADEWLGNLTPEEIGVSPNMSDDDIRSLAEQLTLDAKKEGAIVYDIEEYLRTLKEEL